MSNTNKKQLIVLAILAVSNLLISNLTVGDGRTLEGHTLTAGSPEMRKSIISTLFFGIQLISFIVGALVAAIPYKGISYSVKWITVSLGIAIVVQATFFLIGIIKLLI
ncbi:hypothetical protein MUN82_19585 [Hymenobacter aerilatus]|uniref:Uncharacterized protein n=1 Tax=Hymenobacter aerilatus TaxID=2932251 RepID=A0A8T9SZ76_9BACT|nr:hypothetical protein [Hymenobacter aerilatus]UOR05126.1 hypothetical protein MUN82_19585 [Hymenobacter aerilatus]